MTWRNSLNPRNFLRQISVSKSEEEGNELSILPCKVFFSLIIGKFKQSLYSLAIILQQLLELFAERGERNQRRKTPERRVLKEATVPGVNFLNLKLRERNTNVQIETDGGPSYQTHSPYE